MAGEGGTMKPPEECHMQEIRQLNSGICYKMFVVTREKYGVIWLKNGIH
jgi:hypothetical protein